MFEGKPLQAPVPHDPAEDGGHAESLRGLTWSDLRARLDAARDLRTSLRDSPDEHLASFDAHSARRIAALAEGKHVVNPDDLANGKGSGCIEGVSHDADFGSDPRK